MLPNEWTTLVLTTHIIVGRQGKPANRMVVFHSFQIIVYFDLKKLYIQSSRHSLRSKCYASKKAKITERACYSITIDTYNSIITIILYNGAPHPT